MRADHKVLLCCVAWLTFGLPVAAAAQKSPKPEPLEDNTIIVTAQRRNEAVENVPISVTVVPSEELIKAGVVSMESLNRVAVGVQLNFAGIYFQPAIRGISTLTNGPQVENNVAVYIDGMYDPSSTTIQADLANVADIQVLKGPQGTLYGRNATGGAILINTLGPSDSFTGRIEGGYGRFDEKRAAAYLAGPLSDRVRFSATGAYRRNDGYFKLVSPTTIGQYVGNVGVVEQRSLRLKLDVDLTDNLQANLGYGYAYVRDDRSAFFDTYEHTASFLPGPPQRATVYGTVAHNDPTFQKNHKNQGYLRLIYDTPIGKLTSFTGYAVGKSNYAYDFDGTYAPIVWVSEQVRQATFQQAVDYNIDAIKNLDLLIGGLYYTDHVGHDNGSRAIQSAGRGGGLITASDFDQKVDAWALYLDATYHLNDIFSLTVGGRYSHDEKQMLVVAYNAANVVTLGPFNDKHTWNKFTPRVAIRAEIAPRTNVYASWTRGFRNGNYNTSGPAAGFPFRPTKAETVDAFELGFKTARSGLRFETAAFYYDYDDISVNVAIPFPTCAGQPGCSQSNVFGNAPGAKNYGIDAELTMPLAEGLNLHLAGEWLHARYKTFTNAIGTGVNAANTANITGQIQDWSDKQLARAPKFSGNAGFDYERKTSVGSFLFAANMNFTTGFAVNNVSLYGPLAPVPLRGLQRFRQKGYGSFGAQLTWTDPSEHYYVAVYGNNLTNRTIRLNYNGSALGDYSPKGEPRTYGARVGYKF